VELGEVAPLVVLAEALQRLGDGVERRLVSAFHVGEELEISALSALVEGAPFRGHFAGPLN